VTALLEALAAIEGQIARLDEQLKGAGAALAGVLASLQCGRLQGFGGSGSGDRASLEALRPQ
jgi:hypothetical protein